MQNFYPCKPPPSGKILYQGAVSQGQKSELQAKGSSYHGKEYDAQENNLILYKQVRETQVVEIDKKISKW